MKKTAKSNLIVCLVCIVIVAFIFIGIAITPTRFYHQPQNEVDMAVEDIVLPSRYDSRDNGYVTPVKDQGDSNICWAYASINASEVSILKSGIDKSATNDTLTLSPNGLAYARHNRGKDPLGNTSGEVTGQNWYTTSGDPSYSATVLSQWCGPIDNTISATSNQFENAKYHLNNAVYIDDNSITAIKSAILKYGAVTFSYNNLRETTYYNPKNETSTSSYPHACTLIGWDDNILSSNFVPNGASQNGGWIVKNSYNSLPYFYLSYDNKCSTTYAFDYTNKDTYDYNYFYDYSLTDGLNSTLNNRLEKVGNVFEGKNSSDGFDEYIEAVNVGIWGKDVNCSVQVYTDVTDKTNPQSGKLEATANATFDYGGYRTVELDNEVKIEKGSLFSIVVSVSNVSGNAQIRFMQGGGKDSYIFKDYWTKYPNNTARVKAFTILKESEQNSMDINLASVDVVGDNFVYSGKEIRPKVIAKYDVNVLQEGEDYELSYRNNVNVGTSIITVLGIGDYTGQKQINFTIEKAQQPPTIPQLEMQVENYVNLLNEVTLPSGWSWQNANTLLVDGNNFNLIAEYCDKLNYKNYTAEITVIKKVKPPEVTYFDIYNAEITLPSHSYIYTGQEICPTVTVKYYGKVLLLDKDYNLNYRNNLNVGSATIMVSGKGEYIGSKTIYFTIEKASQPSVLPQLTLSVASDVTTLNEVSLPSGWSWQDGSIVLVDGENTKLVAIYQDTLNFQTYTVEITVIKNAKEQLPPIVDSEDEVRNTSLWWLMTIPVCVVIVAVAWVIAYRQKRHCKKDK